ncbi:MAG: MFS transporter [Streptomyces sp.]|nr:MFS transporter [Streptomyces sp.]
MSQTGGAQTPAKPASTDAAQADQTAHDPGSNRRWLILAIVGVAQLMVVLDTTIVNIALPSAQADLGFSNGSRTWIVTAYSLAFGSLLLLGGRIADLFGRKVAFLVGVGGFAAASALAGAAQNFQTLVAGRVLQGLFAALLAPAALSLVTTTFTDAKERAKAFGFWGAIAGSGAAVGLLLGGVLTEYMNWRSTLYVNLLFAAVALFGGSVLLKRAPRDTGATFDIPGTLLVTTGLFCIVYGFSNAESYNWGSPMSWGFLAGGGVLLAAFTRWQTRAPHPLLPLRILLDRNRAASYTAVLISGIGMYAVFLFVTYYLETSLGYSAVQTGSAFLPMIAALMAGALGGTNYLLPRFSPKVVAPVGALLAATGMVWLTPLNLDSTYIANILPPLLVLGLGIGLIMAPSTSLAVAGVRADDAGVASALVNTVQQIGASIGTPLLNTLAAFAATNYLVGREATSKLVQAQAQLNAYSTAYWWAAGFYAAGAVITVLLFHSGVPRTDPDAAPAVHM